MSVVIAILRVPNSGRQMGIANARHAVSLQNVQCHFACVVLAPAGIVEENAAGFLGEGNDKFGSRSAAVRARDHHGMSVCLADVCD